MRYFLLLVLVATSAYGLTKVKGDPITVSWTPPTEYTDNTPLPATDLDYYTVKWVCDAVVGGRKRVDAPQVSTRLDAELLGNCSITVSVTVKNSSTSKESDSVSLLVKLPKPSYGGFR